LQGDRKRRPYIYKMLAQPISDGITLLQGDGKRRPYIYLELKVTYYS